MATSIIENDLIIEGDVSSSEGDLEINGTVTGSVSARSVIVRIDGATNGEMSAGTATIEGKHAGSLNCDELLLTSTSEVAANVIAITMAIQSGAKFNGTAKVASGE